MFTDQLLAGHLVGYLVTERRLNFTITSVHFFSYKLPFGLPPTVPLSPRVAPPPPNLKLPTYTKLLTLKYFMYLACTVLLVFLRAPYC